MGSLTEIGVEPTIDKFTSVGMLERLIRLLYRTDADVRIEDSKSKSDT